VGSAGIAVVSFKCHFGPRLEAAERDAAAWLVAEEAEEQRRQEAYVRERMLAMAMAPPRALDDDDCFF
jgi:hypothetical protein